MSCPSCLGQSPVLGAALRLVGLFLLVPPAIFFAVAIAIRKLTRGHGPAGTAASAAGSGGGVQGGWSRRRAASADASGRSRRSTSDRT